MIKEFKEENINDSDFIDEQIEMVEAIAKHVFNMLSDCIENINKICNTYKEFRGAFQIIIDAGFCDECLIQYENTTKEYIKRHMLNMLQMLSGQED